MFDGGGIATKSAGDIDGANINARADVIHGIALSADTTFVCNGDRACSVK